MTAPKELSRADMGDLARRLESLAGNMETRGSAIIRAILAIVPIDGALAGEAHGARAAMISNRAHIKDEAGKIIIWSLDANSQRTHADMDRALIDAGHHLALLRDCLHDAALDLTRYTYAIITDYDRIYEETTKEIKTDDNA